MVASTIEPRSNRPVFNGILPITETKSWSLWPVSFYFLYWLKHNSTYNRLNFLVPWNRLEKDLTVTSHQPCCLLLPISHIHVEKVPTVPTVPSKSRGVSKGVGPGPYREPTYQDVQTSTPRKLKEKSQHAAPPPMTMPTSRQPKITRDANTGTGVHLANKWRKVCREKKKYSNTFQIYQIIFLVFSVLHFSNRRCGCIRDCNGRVTTVMLRKPKKQAQS